MIAMHDSCNRQVSLIALSLNTNTVVTKSFAQAKGS